MKTLIIFFLSGYLVFVFILFKRVTLPYELVIGPVFAGGALFVFIVINFTRDIISLIKSAEEELRSMNVTLEQRVADRTSALRQSHTFLKTVLDGLHDEVAVIDPHTFKIQDANLAFLSQYGMNRDAVIGKTCYEITHQRVDVCSPPHDICPLLETMNTGRFVTAEHTHFDKNGEKIYVEVSTSPIKDSDGTIKQIVHVSHNITERKATELKIQENEEQFRRLFDLSPIGALIISPDFLILNANEAFCSFIGYRDEDLRNRSFIEINHSEDLQGIKTALQAMREGKLDWFQIENRYERKDGHVVWGQVSIRPLRDRSGNILYFLPMIVDITERKKAEEAKILLEEQLHQAQKMEALGQLTGGIAHDFNNILSAIIGYGSLLQMKMTGEDPLMPYVEQILASSESAANLTRGLLAFSRKQVILLKPLNLNDIIRNVGKLLVRLIGEDIAIKTILPEKDLIVMADYGQIEQILINLATNARDAMPAGGQLTISSERFSLDNSFIQTHGYGVPGRYALVSVSDTGGGIKEEIQEKIFEPFFTTKEMGRGTGLGLAIVYGVVKQHNGFVNVSSEIGKGTTFKMYFPLIHGEVYDELQKTESPLKLPRGSETILLAEDDLALRKLSSSALTEFGYTIIEAFDGEDAIQKFMEHKDRIQLVMLDVIMPGKNGTEVYQEIKKIRPDMRVFFVSGYASDIIQKKGILEEGVELLMKPISPKDLLIKIRKILDR